ncbi:hypothetical protein KBD49_11815 [Myxococcota bacterium]|jgi:hypothetical protein|nr:hypothetical protein [Myxococcota bacterium]
MERFPWRPVIVAALISLGIADPVEARPHRPRPFAAPAFVPSGGFLLPDGVFYVRQGGMEVFWADGCYWTLDPRSGWYRAWDWNGPWVFVEPMWVPRQVVVLTHRPGFHGPRGTWYPWARWERHHRDVRPPARYEPYRRDPVPRRDDRWDRRRDGPDRRDRRHR